MSFIRGLSETGVHPSPRVEEIQEVASISKSEKDVYVSTKDFTNGRKFIGCDFGMEVFCTEYDIVVEEASNSLQRFSRGGCCYRRNGGCTCSVGGF